jgi:hypothetical protein
MSRQDKGDVVNEARRIDHGDRACRIDEYQITGIELNRATIVVEGRSAGDLNEDSVVLATVKAGVSRGAIETFNVAPDVHRAQSVDAEGLEPADKALWVDPHGIDRTGLSQR